MHVKDRQCIEVIGMVRFDGQGVLQRGFGFIVAPDLLQEKSQVVKNPRALRQAGKRIIFVVGLSSRAPIPLGDLVFAFHQGFQSMKSIVAQPFSQRFQFGGPPLSRKILANIHFANLLWSQILLSISLVNTALQKQVE